MASRALRRAPTSPAPASRPRGAATPTSPRLEWDDLKVILALLRSGSLAKAGRQLGVNLSTVSRRLDAIEAGLGLHLFSRGASGVIPTDLALALAPSAEAMERAAADATRALASRETAPDGVVRITAPPGLASWLIAPLLPELRSRYPNLRVELLAAITYADLTRQEADLALRSRRPTHGDLVSVRLLADTLAVGAAGPRVAELGCLRDPAAVDWIGWGDELAHLPEGQWLATHVPPERVALRSNSLDAQVQACRAGLGLVLAHRGFLALCGLHELPVAPTLARGLAALPVGTLWLVGHRGQRDIPRIRAVWALIVERTQALAVPQRPVHPGP